MTGVSVTVTGTIVECPSVSEIVTFAVPAAFAVRVIVVEFGVAVTGVVTTLTTFVLLLEIVKLPL